MNNENHPYNTLDLLRERNIEIITAALLVTGKLRVNFVSVFRDEPTIEVVATGDFPSLNNDNQVIDHFIKENGDMTVSDLMEKINERLNQERGT
ncbi:hypothetical protein [Natribacillus halophilus]|uniref:Uncharacterized protein n=1 Tax=Natribacillus halophilus TaxID=549003 RepID=A0A1G8KSH4_9BACI|nr:hypothetical protein [Natribacillus halophilus]SDI46337.1 hypothetical protein SAMN04488123_102273 [Natribacillus halophilus]